MKWELGESENRAGQRVQKKNTENKNTNDDRANCKMLR